MTFAPFTKLKDWFAPPLSPSAPAENVTSSDLLKKVRAIQIKTNHLVDDFMTGEYHSAFKGRGMEFSEVREYSPGDDVRLIDWNVTARMSHPFIKEFIEERELTVTLLVDVSASGNFGTGEHSKSEIAAEIASLLAFSAIKNNDKVGLIVFSDRIERYIPPKKGKAHIWNIIRSILEFNPEGKGTDLKLPLEYLTRIQKRKSVAFLISDFQDSGFEKSLKLANQKHDLVAICIRDPREFDWPNVGMLYLEDKETGEKYLANSGNDALRKQYRQIAEQAHTDFLKLFRSLGVGVIDIDTRKSLTQPIIRFFKQREKRR
ncbi:MAG: DUF58 domain-containing protein [Nitrospinae bacterium CG11_big_fil_rev_8_21_14_0_20_45_15]|nr:MAG: DUF58 domain-containing protein [Nitrospinae bacterium CG11_big_fil_rev_8_21_14_0_20_45_15]